MRAYLHPSTFFQFHFVQEETGKYKEPAELTVRSKRTEVTITLQKI
jgi:hypothetical protein